MGLFDKLKKSMELKQNTPNENTIQKTLGKISKLEKKLIENPDNTHFLIELYECLVEVSDTTKKIECLIKISKLKPNDAYPLQQLADIYLNELDDIEQAKYFQNKANKIKKFF